MATYSGNQKQVEVAPVVEKLKKPKKTPQTRCTRATNAVLRSIAVIVRRGAPLTEAQKEKIFAALERSVAEAKATLAMTKAEQKSKFSLE